MKVKDLIKNLEEFPADMEVVVQGYEGGCTNISVVEPISVFPNVNTEWYYGPHEQVDDYNREKFKDFPQTKMVYVG